MPPVPRIEVGIKNGFSFLNPAWVWAGLTSELTLEVSGKADLGALHDHIELKAIRAASGFVINPEPSVAELR